MEASRKAECPNCLGSIEFKLGSSAAMVCPYCRFSIVRSDRDLTAIGKIADLVPTAAVMGVGDIGGVDGREFVVGGRLQLDHGKGPWDEWYIEWSNDRTWSWLTKAQGNWYITSKVDVTGLPTWDQMSPGTKGKLHGGGEQDWTVQERGGSALISAEGELPAPAIPGESGRYVDLVAAGGGFATIDYGDGTGNPELFVGKQVAHDKVELRTRALGAPPEEVIQAKALECPNCGADIPIMVPGETERAACQSCHSLLDFNQGALKLLGQLKQPQVTPDIPLGTKGKINGLDVLCIGFMERICVIEGETYAWREYLLHSPQGYKWILEDSGHFIFIGGASAGDVSHTAAGVSVGGSKFKLFSTVQTQVRFVIGEFYWKVEVGETARATDYIAPPFIFSEEKNSKEVTWSRGEHIDGKQVWQAFGLPGNPPAPVGVGVVQPNTISLTFPLIFAAITLVVLAGLAFVLTPKGGGATLMNGAPIVMPQNADAALARRGENKVNPISKVQIPGMPVIPGMPGTGVAVPATPSGPSAVPAWSPHFTLGAKDDAVRVTVTSNLGQGWLGVACALIHEPTGEIREFLIETDRFHSGSGGTSDSVIIGQLKPGAYILRTDARWARKTGSANLTVPPQAKLHVQTYKNQGGWCCCIFAGLLLIFPIPFTMMRRTAFERKRWSNANL